MKQKKYILDTSALLSDPDLVFSFHHAEIIIPQIVLSELDRLKTSRVDRALVFRGREVSRILYSLSKQGKLTDGVETERGSIIKIMPSDNLGEIPYGLNLKNADDIILAMTHNIIKQNPEADVTLITSDLNMLLRAQTLEITVERIEEKLFKKSFVQRVKEERELKLLLSLIVILLLGGIISTSLYVTGYLTPPSKTDVKEADFRVREESYKRVLRENPRDIPARKGLGNLYFDNKLYSKAIIEFRSVLEIEPDDTDVRSKMAISYLEISNYDIALTEFGKVLDRDPSYSAAYYYSGLAFEKKGYPVEAAQQYEAYLQVDPKGQYAKSAEDRLKNLGRR
jgi:tetratricopeptide (TPR) repeat protein